MDSEVDERLLIAVTRLASQVNAIACTQQHMLNRLQRQPKEHKISVHFPTPSIVESTTMIDCPFTGGNVFSSIDIPQDIDEGDVIIGGDEMISPKEFFTTNPQQPRILIVEDDPICKQLLLKVLAQLSTDITAVGNGREALLTLQTSHFDLVLMDIQMPIMDGLTATRAIRQFDGRTPIISLTAACGPEEMRRYRAVGMNECLSKPFSTETLSRLLHKYCKIDDI